MSKEKKNECTQAGFSLWHDGRRPLVWESHAIHLEILRSHLEASFFYPGLSIPFVNGKDGF
jgi:hypothetical protein